MTVTTLVEKPKTRSLLNPKYKAWHDAVLARDNGLCQQCFNPGTHAHHLEGWWVAKDKRFDVDNGKTLCRPCHEELHGFKFGIYEKSTGDAHRSRVFLKALNRKTGILEWVERRRYAQRINAAKVWAARYSNRKERR